MKKKVILTTEQIEKVFEAEQITLTANQHGKPLRSANVGEVANDVRNQATAAGVTDYSFDYNASQATPGQEDITLSINGETPEDCLRQAQEKVAELPNPDGANVHCEVDENIVYTKAKVEEMKAENLKKSGTIMTLKEFNEYLKK